MMKSKLAILFVFVFVAMLFLPTPAQAWCGVTGLVTDGRTSQPWTNGGTVTAYGDTGGGYVEIGTSAIDTGTGIYTITYTGSPLPFSTVYLSVILDPGSEGTPSNQVVQITEIIPTNTDCSAGASRYTQNIRLDTGPDAVELANFSVTPQTSNNWLPFVLLIGSVALVGGAVTFIRKRR